MTLTVNCDLERSTLTILDEIERQHPGPECQVEVKKFPATPSFMKETYLATNVEPKFSAAFRENHLQTECHAIVVRQAGDGTWEIMERDCSPYVEIDESIYSRPHNGDLC